MRRFNNPEVKKVFDDYPEEIRQNLLHFRDLIFEVAAGVEPSISIDESLRWSEPAYLCKTGSTIRIGYKKNNPREFAMYFNCKTQLIETIQEVFGTELRYEGNRALVFQLDQSVNTSVVKQCILLALRYHKLKHLPLLGL